MTDRHRHEVNPMHAESANWGISEKQRAALVGSLIDRQWWEGIIQEQHGGGIDTSDKTWLVVIARKGPENWNIHEFTRAFNYLKRFNGNWVNGGWRSRTGFTWEMFMVELDVLVPHTESVARHQPLVVVPPDDDPDDDYVDLDPPAPESEPEPEPVTRRGQRSLYVALTPKLKDALDWVAAFTEHGGITTAALAAQIGDITPSGAHTRIKKLMQKGLVTWAPGEKESYIVSDFWYEAKVVVS